MLRDGWGEVLSDSGFRRLPRHRAAGWYRPAGDLNVLVHAAVDQHGWDPFRGSDFVVEFELAAGLLPGGHWDKRGRLGEDMEPEVLAQVLAQQNAVIRRLPAPPAEVLPTDAAGARDYLRHFFEPVTELHPNDLHFRYLDEQDAAAWVELLRPLLTGEADKFIGRVAQD